MSAEFHLQKYVSWKENGFYIVWNSLKSAASLLESQYCDGLWWWIATVRTLKLWRFLLWISQLLFVLKDGSGVSSIYPQSAQLSQSLPASSNAAGSPSKTVSRFMSEVPWGHWMWAWTLQESKFGSVLALHSTVYKLKVLLNSYSRIILLIYWKECLT